jgi:hypothetical protein
MTGTDKGRIRYSPQKLRVVVEGELCLSFVADRQYNYVLSAALDVGTLLSALVIFFCLGLTGAKLDWIGNRIHTRSQFLVCSLTKTSADFSAADWNGEGAARYDAPVTGFGPDTCEWHNCDLVGADAAQGRFKVVEILFVEIL